MRPTLSERLTLAFSNFERKRARLHEKNAELNGLDMAYYENDTGRDKPTLILVHGYTAEKATWHRLARYLGKDYHIIAPDMAGHGATPYDANARYDIPTQVSWLNAFLEHIGIESAHFIGSSMGGFICASFAHAHPDKTQSVSLLNPAGISSPEQSEIAKIYAQGKNMFLPDSVDDFNALLELIMAKPPYIPGFIRRTLARYHMSRNPDYAHIFKDFFDKDTLEDKLGDITAPVLLIWGRQDQILHVSAAPIWQKGLKSCQTLIWDDLGHIPAVEDPARTANAISTFIASI